MQNPRNFSDILSDLNINLFATILTNTEYGFEHWCINDTLYRPIPSVAGEFYGYSSSQIEAYLGPLYEFQSLGTFRCVDRESPNWAPGTNTIWVKSGGHVFLFVQSWIYGWRLAIDPEWPSGLGPVDVNDLFDLVPANYQLQSPSLQSLARGLNDNPELAVRVYQLGKALWNKLLPLAENSSSRHPRWGVKQFQDLLNRVPSNEPTSDVFKPDSVEVPWKHLL